MALVNQQPSVFEDDDEAPLSFKRPSNSVKSRPAAPSKQQGSSSENVVPVRSPKPVAPNPQKNGVTSPSRPVHLKPQSSSSLNHRPSGSGQPNNADTSKLKRPYVKDEQPDDSDDDKPIGLRKKVEEKKLKRVDVGGVKAEDSDEDHKPLSLKRISSTVPSSSKDKAVVQKVAPKVEQPDDDSDDDKPLASRLPTNSAPKSGGNASDSEDEKPSASVNLKSGSSNNVSNGSQNLGKRPLDTNNQTSSALKNAKPPGVSTPAGVKRESKVDDNDNVPLAQRLKIAESSKSKTPEKNIVNLSLQQAMEESDSLQKRYNQEMRSMQSAAREHTQRVFQETDQLRKQLVEKEGNIQRRSRQLSELVAQTDMEIRRLEKERQKNADQNNSLNMARIEQQKADEKVMQLLEIQKKEKEAAWKKILQLERQLDEKRKLELDIQQLRVKLAEVEKHMEGEGVHVN